MSVLAGLSPDHLRSLTLDQRINARADHLVLPGECVTCGLPETGEQLCDRCCWFWQAPLRAERAWQEARPTKETH